MIAVEINFLHDKIDEYNHTIIIIDRDMKN